MKPVIPFLGRMSAAERSTWLEHLRASLKDVADIECFEDMPADRRATARVAIVANPDPADVAALPGLVWVQSLWAGVERLSAELPGDGPQIVRLVDPQMAQTMSEAVLAWTLYLHRDMPVYRRQQDKAVWREHQLKTPQERTIGILGLGNLGSASARRLKANGFNVVGWSRSAKTLDGIATVCGQDGLKTVLGQSDIVVVLIPLTAQTRGLLGPDTFQYLKQGASLINFARGAILDTPTLLERLDTGHVAHAVLDVFDQEPLPGDSPFWRHPDVTVLPHISAPTLPITASGIVVDNIKTYLESGNIPPSVDRTRGY